MQLASNGKPASRQRLEWERRRLGQVRKSFAAAVEQKTAGAEIPLEFLCACVDYIGAALDRLHAQDQTIHDRLLRTVAEDRSSDLLAHLAARLAASRDAVAALRRGAEAYRRTGGADWPSFGHAIARFMDVYLNTLLSGQHSTLTLQEKHFDEAAWTAVAQLDDRALQNEATLFAWIEKLAPAGLSPAQIPSSRPRGA